METGNRLQGKVAIVTGGASGIGAVTARIFAGHGANVMVCDVNDAMGNSIVDEIGSSGGNAAYRTLEVTNEAGWSDLVAETVEIHGRLDVLTNIAGISGRDPQQNIQTTLTAGGLLEDQSLEKWNQIMEVNATGTFLGTKAVLAPMRDSGGGSVINISSICGIIGSFANAAYHASKGAVRIFSKSAAIQYAADGIRVNSIHPGFVDTPMTKPGHSNPEVAQKRIEATPLGRFGTPRDIAMGCLYLASDEASWITGTELIIDGGMTANCPICKIWRRFAGNNGKPKEPCRAVSSNFGLGRSVEGADSISRPFPAMSDRQQQANSSSQGRTSNHIERIVVPAPMFHHNAKNRWTGYDAEEQEKLASARSFANFSRRGQTGEFR